MIRRLPFYVVLLPVFFITHVFNEYYQLISILKAGLFLSYYLLFAAVLVCIGRLMFKSWFKAGIWATGLLLIFFFFGATRGFLTGRLHAHFIASYKVILPLLLIALILFSIYIRKSKRSFALTTRYFIALLTIITVFEVVQLAYKNISGATAKTDVGHGVAATVQDLTFCNQCTKPDIFFIVLDEYPSSASLEQNFSFNNNWFDSVLTANHFYIARKSKSNYRATPFSISSTLDLDYFPMSIPDDRTAKFWLQGWYALKKSKVPQRLAMEGYKVCNFGLCDLDHFPIKTVPYYAASETKVLFKETLFGSIATDIWWNMEHLPIHAIQSLFAENHGKDLNNFVNRNFYNLTSVLTELKTQSDTPKFVFGHIMMPHWPFLYDQNGKLHDRATVDNDEHNKELFLQQLQYTNKLMVPLIQAAGLSFNRPRIVIIEGDHGFRDNREGTVMENDFMNLSTYFFSDKDYSLLHDSISPVNTFRVVFNKYFHTRLPLLKDSMVATPF